MQYVPLQRWKIALPLWVCCGTGAYLLIALGTGAVVARGGPPPLMTVLVANLIYPVSLVTVAIWYPRTWFFPFGGALALLGYAFTRMIYIDLRPAHWTWVELGAGFHPVLVIGTAASVIFATFVSISLSPMRRVGTPPIPQPRCAQCGYSLTGNTTGRCPECGAGQFQGEVS